MKKNNLSKKRIVIELHLLQRLRWIGGVLLLIGGGFLYEAIRFSQGKISPPGEEETLCPYESFNFFALALLFFLVGFLCFYVVRKKNNTLTKK